MASTPNPRPTESLKTNRLITISLKMWRTPLETSSFLKEIKSLDESLGSTKTTLIILPDFLSIPQCASLLSTTKNIILGAQNCHFEDSGAFTGEVSPRSLAELGVKVVMVGHMERRSLFGETDVIVAKKVEAILRNGMVPLLCVSERSKPTPIVSQSIGLALSEIKSQLSLVLSILPDTKPVIIAYEPVWAIGALQAAGSDHIMAVVEGIRGIVSGMESKKEDVRVCYGGTVKPGIWRGIAGSVDGVLLGRFGTAENIRALIEEMRDGES